MHSSSGWSAQSRCRLAEATAAPRVKAATTKPSRLVSFRRRGRRSSLGAPRGTTRVEAVKADNPNVEVTETFEAYHATRAEPVVRQMLDDGASVMLLSTFVLADVATSVAKDYPDVPMVVSSFVCRRTRTSVR